MASGPVASSPKGFPTFARGADDAHVGPSMHGAVPAPNAGARTAGHISSPTAHPHVDSSLHATNPEAKRQGLNLSGELGMATDRPSTVVGPRSEAKKVTGRIIKYNSGASARAEATFKYKSRGSN